MPIRPLPVNVYEAALSRFHWLYEHGHRPVLGISGGKDSTVLLNLGIQAAEAAGQLPVDAITRDDEIMYPGIFEYLERVAQDPRVRLRWVYAHQPVINIFNRQQPYFWTFDPALPPEQWVRRPPAFAESIAELDIRALVSPYRFPPPLGGETINVMAVRAQESLNRRRAIFSAHGWLTKRQRARYNLRSAMPMYDWRETDVWHAIKEFGWDYARCYDVFHRHGLKGNRLRTAPPSMSPLSVPAVLIAAQAWPEWFDRVCERLPGMRSVAMFGTRVLIPQRRRQELWSQVYERECIREAPAWIAERASRMRDFMLDIHARHSPAPFPEFRPCRICGDGIGCWRKLARAMFNGDPFSQSQAMLPYLEPTYFRAGTGSWRYRVKEESA